MIFIPLAPALANSNIISIVHKADPKASLTFWTPEFEILFASPKRNEMFLLTHVLIDGANPEERLVTSSKLYELDKYLYNHPELPFEVLEPRG